MYEQLKRYENFIECVEDLITVYPELGVISEEDGVRFLDELATVENAFRTCRELADAVNRLTLENDMLKEKLENFENADR